VREEQGRQASEADRDWMSRRQWRAPPGGATLPVVRDGGSR
jgi:hypothetical protein